MGFRYRAFGIAISSDIEFPELHASDGVPEVTIRSGSVPLALRETRARGVRYQAGPSEYLLSVDGVAKYWVDAGRTIHYQKQAGAHEDAVRLFLLGRPMGALLHQRGIVPLHAGAIRVGTGAVAFAGPSGAGKSTIVAAFRKRGYSVFTDEVCAIAPGSDGAPEVFPGVPYIKLWHDAAKRLGEDPKTLRRVRPEQRKFWLACGDAYQASALPLLHLYVVRTHNGPDWKITPLRGAARVQAFLSDTYSARLIQGLGGRQRHFENCAAAARLARASRFLRPAEGLSVDAMADALEADFNRS